MMKNAGESARLFVAASDEAEQRLDHFLVSHCPDLSRNQIQKAIGGGFVLVDGRTRAKNHRLRSGQAVELTLPPREELKARPQAIPLDIIHQDSELLIVNKPAGMVVHPAPGHPDGTLVNALMHHCRQLADSGHPLRPGIVHRLDRDTSGLLVVALTDQAHRSLAAQLKDRSLGRHYLAISWGRWRQDKGTLTGALGRHPSDRLRMAVVAEGGRTATTHHAVAADYGFVQLCRVVLESGRTHQIRVHFAHRGHPVVGDALYGDDRRARNVAPAYRARAQALVKAAQRQLLHATELHLVHPSSGQELVFNVPPPPDFQRALAILDQEV